MRADAVIGIGNPLRRDDGIGPACLVALGELPGVDLIELDGEATRLIDAWADRGHVVVVDAVVRASPPGTLHRLELGRDRFGAGFRNASSHTAGLGEAVALGQVLGRMPLRLQVIGLEPADTGLGPELSPPVRAGFSDLVTAVRACVLARGDAASA